jgi:uncharacterized glyoxalase superfamily protein PhnB
LLPALKLVKPASSPPYSFYHSDLDGLYARLVAAGYRIETPPRDVEWGERCKIGPLAACRASRG